MLRMMRVSKGNVRRCLWTTRAAVCENLSTGHVHVEPDWQFYDEEVLGPKSVHVETRCAGINFGELLQLKGQYQEKLDPPFVPGNEVSGIVKAVGSKVTRAKVGEAIIALPRGGGWARDVVVNENAVLSLGDAANVDFGQAAALAVSYGTAHMALVERAKLLKGETVLITAAAGGVGLACVELALHFGAKVIACASTLDKLNLARAKGAHATVAYKDDPKEFRNDIRQAAAACGSDKAGIDVAIDMVGGHLLEALVRSMNFDGRAVVVGFASGKIPKIPANILLVKNVALIGLYWGSYAKHNPPVFQHTAKTVATLWQQGIITPHVGSRFPLDNVNDAVHAIQARTTSGKVVLDIFP